MSTFRSTYRSIVAPLAPAGRWLFLPLATARVTEQTTCFTLHTILWYLFALISYGYNFIFMRNNDEPKAKSFQDELRHQQEEYHHGVLDEYSKSAAENVKEYFDVPTSASDFLAKVWFRSAYYYDKHVVHLSPLVSSTAYLYNPPPKDQADESVAANTSMETNASITSIAESDSGSELHVAFTPKPYILSERSASRIHPAGKLASQNALGEISSSPSPVKPALAELFDQSAPIPQPQPITTATATTEVTSRPGSRNLFRIHIRKKDKMKEHPTYQRYDLVRQKVIDSLVQPTYQPDGNIGPNLIRFTWHCCAHYNQEDGTGGCGGGTMRFAQEFNDNGNTGLHTAKSYLDQIHEEFPWISFADLYTLGGVAAIEGLGGPVVPWTPGRTDCPNAQKVPPMGRLPIATLGSDHIRTVFGKRLGFSDKETVVLIGGGHSLGGCHTRFSGFNGRWTMNHMKWDNDFFKVLLNDTWELGLVPESGVEQYWNKDHSLMMLNTDMELLWDPEFRKWTEAFAKDEDLFNQEFANAFGKLLELGVIRDEDGIQRKKI